jgi:hypothetical protein
MRKFLFSCTMLAALGANAVADEPDCPFASRSEPGVCPFVSGSEPGWGKHLSSTQRRTMGFDDTRVARKYGHKPSTSGPEARLNAPARGVPGYAFNVLTFNIGSYGRVSMNQIKSEPFGVYATMEECDEARARKIANLDRRDARFPHLAPNSVQRTTHFANGSSVTEPKGPAQRMDVTFCEPGVYTPKPSFNIAKDAVTPTATPVAYSGTATQTTTLEVAPGFVKHWVAPQPFTRVIPGTSEVVEILSAVGRELVFMVKPDIASPPTTNILLVNDDGEVVANLRIVIPGILNHEVRQGPDGTQVYRKDNPNYVAPKEKK